MLQHSPFTNNVSYTLRADDWDRSAEVRLGEEKRVQHTFLLANVFECECQARVLPLDNAHLSEGTFSDHAKEAKVIEVD